MIRLKESIIVQNPLPEVFDYVSDFGHIQEWDPGVLSSKKNAPGKAGVGSSYELVLKFGPFRPKMRYTITAFEELSKVVLEGQGDSFTATDIIGFQQTDNGVRIDYRADIRFKGSARRLEPVLTPIMKQIGRTAILGLAAQLAGTGRTADRTGWFRSGSGLADFLADHAIVPGMLMFSRYGYHFSRRFWTAPPATLHGRKIVLTGGTSGIGKAAAVKLAEKKAFLTIVARNAKKADQVCRQIVEETGNPHVDAMIADLSLMKDIRRVSREIINTKKNIDILINNAGALFNHRQETPEGIEQTFATDLLGVFYLTMQLKDALARSTDPRIINVSSGGMYTQKIDIQDLENARGPYNGAKAYARAKRGLVILTGIWARQFKTAGIRVHAMHPGWVDTPGVRQSLPRFHQALNRILRTPEQGADTIVWLAQSRAAGQRTGLFWMDRRPHETRVFPGTGESRQERQQLWEQLNALTQRAW